ncbi:ankyrin repeat domain-containing protein [Aspergillus lucknowensis]|uniref:Ankyrin repeat-containing domain protein n=1 Tax=Aspergillus lucknowensis TaxID=176173 RepID=A0ABR4LNW6_9EURO
MSFAALPSEIILLIAESLETQSDLSALTRSSWRLHNLLSDLLAVQNIRHSNSSALVWASEQGNLELASRMVKLGANLETIRKGDTATPLFIAAANGHTSILNLLLESRANPNATDNESRTPLYAAAAAGNEEVVRILFSREDVNFYAKCRRGATPFAVACNKGNEAVARLFLDKPGLDVTAGGVAADPHLLALLGGHEGVMRLLLDDGRFDVNYKDPNEDYTLLMYAARAGWGNFVSLLLERGADPNKRTGSSGQTALFYAIAGDQDAILQLLLSREDVDRNIQDTQGRSPLLWAAEWPQRTTILQTLLGDPGVDARSRNSLGRNALNVAMAEGHKPAAEILLADGRFPVDEGDVNGELPIFWAAWKGYTDIMDLLVKAGATVDCRDNRGRTPLFRAAEHAAIWLLGKGVSPDLRDEEGRTPLSWAAEDGRVEVMDVLLGHGAEIDSRDRQGWTPLFWALARGCFRTFQTTKFLIERGADPNARDEEGRTPLLIAAEWSFFEHRGRTMAFTLLLEKGVDQNVKDKDGRTPLSWAAGFPNHSLMRALLDSKGIDRNPTDNEGRTVAWWAECVDGEDYDTKSEDEIQKSLDLLETWGI